MLDKQFHAIKPSIANQVHRDALYAHYIQRQDQSVEALKRDEQKLFPTNFDFSSISGLSNELRLKLATASPSSLAQASRVDGMTPAALTLLLAHIKRAERAVG